MCLKKIGCLVSVFSQFFFRNKSWLGESLFEHLRQQKKQVFLISVSYCFHFCAIYCCSVAYDLTFISLQDHCSKNILNIRLIDLKYFVSASALSSLANGVKVFGR